jgi:hypothetical protein
VWCRARSGNGSRSLIRQSIVLLNEQSVRLPHRLFCSTGASDGEPQDVSLAEDGMRQEDGTSTVYRFEEPAVPFVRIESV